jgi:methyl-accepting chemotaxis protein
LEILEDRTLLNSPSAALALSTFLGGTDYDLASSVAVDASGNVYITGNTNSKADFPILNSAQPILNGLGDAFVAKFSPNGALLWSTYLGGSQNDAVNAIAVDASGNVYVTGYTFSPNFPTTAGAAQKHFLGSEDAFVAKYSTNGTLMYSTFLGGSSFDYGNGITVDAAGHVYVTGTTGSADFPTTPGVAQSKFGGFSDAFVAELDTAKGGTAGLVYSTYLGGDKGDAATAIAVDPSGNAYVTGVTASHDLPTTASAFASDFPGDTSAFVVKLKPGGTLAYATYLGGGPEPMPGYGADIGKGIGVDAFGNAYVTGQTYSRQFPTTAGAVQSSVAGPPDAFVAKLDTTKSGAKSLVWSTYLGGSSDEVSNAITVTPAGNIAVTGSTFSNDFPTTPGAFKPHHASDKVFVAQLSANGSLSFSTYIVDSASAFALGIAADASNNLYIAGATQSSHYPTTAGAFQPTFGGYSDAFLSKISLAGSSGGGGSGGGSGGASGGGGSGGGGHSGGGSGRVVSGSSSPGATANNPSALFRQSWLGLNASINQVLQKAIQFVSNAIQIQIAMGVFNDPLLWALSDLKFEEASHVFQDFGQVTISADKVLLDISSVFLSVEKVFSSLDQNTLGLDQVLLSLDQVFPGIEQVTQSLEQATQSLNQVTLGLDQVTQSQDQVLEDINKVFGLP